MTELDFDRQGAPFKRTQKEGFRSPADELTRKELLPLVGKLSPEQKQSFESQLIISYAPEVTAPHDRTGSEILRRLSLKELEEVVEALKFIAGQDVS